MLRSIIPVYDKVNMAISMGKANRYREMGIRGNVFPETRYLMPDPVSEICLESLRN